MDNERLPLSGRRWLWILLVLVAIIVIAIAVGSEPASKGIPMGAPATSGPDTGASAAP